MSMELRRGNIFKQKDVEMIIHQANCMNTMGSGVAKQIANLYSGAVEADNRTKKGDKTKLGSFTEFTDTEKDMIIVNLYSQYDYLPKGICHTDYRAMETALSEVIEDYGTHRVISDEKLVVGVPYMMGCDRGGGDWNTVLDILTKLFKDNEDFHLVVCRLENK